MAQSVHFVAQGANRIESCPSGGWMLKPGNTALPSYWIPQPPSARKLDSQGRILSEKKVPIASFNISPEELSVEVEFPETWIWTGLSGSFLQRTPTSIAHLTNSHPGKATGFIVEFTNTLPVACRCVPVPGSWTCLRGSIHMATHVENLLGTRCLWTLRRSVRT